MKRMFILVVILFLILTLIVLFCFSFINLFFSISQEVKITTEPITISNTITNPANNMQFQTNTLLSVFDGKLYFYPKTAYSYKYITQYHQYLSVFDQGAVVKLKKLDDRDIICGMSNDLIYFRHLTENNDYDVFCYEIATGRESYLVTVNNGNIRDYFFDNEGLFFIPIDRDCSYYWSVKGNVVINKTSQGQIHTIGQRQYAVENNEIVFYDESGKRNSLDNFITYARHRTLIPSKNGLIIHNESQGDLLYYIDVDTGVVKELFSVQCMQSVSAVNVYENYVFLSFKRYEKNGEIGMVRFENDTLEGTYRINLNDYSVEKISDQIYNGLYIFDETGIYACDDYCNIYKLDFDGNCVLTLLEQAPA